MESISAILILVPVLMPVAIAFRCRSSSFWINYNFEFINWNGHASYGITLFVASSIAERSIVDVSKKLLIPLSLMFFVLFLATLFS